jgi:predicted  nucleic acid-binding Zn-ribbon protein
LKKSDYRILVAGLNEEIELLKSRNFALAQQIKNMPNEYEHIKKERDEWRVKFEQVEITPELKANVEEAFKRGEDSAKKKFSSWLMHSAQNLSEDLN